MAKRNKKQRPKFKLLATNALGTPSAAHDSAQTGVIDLNDAYAPGQVLLAYVEYEDQTGGKQRPVLVIRDLGDRIEVRAFTSSDTSPLRTEAIDWRAHGLRRTTRLRWQKTEIARSDVRHVIAPMTTTRDFSF